MRRRLRRRAGEKNKAGRQRSAAGGAARGTRKTAKSGTQKPPHKAKERRGRSARKSGAASRRQPASAKRETRSPRRDETTGRRRGPGGARRDAGRAGRAERRAHTARPQKDRRQTEKQGPKRRRKTRGDRRRGPQKQNIVDQRGRHREVTGAELAVNIILMGEVVVARVVGRVVQWLGRRGFARS